MGGCIYIVEGVAGSGKDRLVQALLAALQPAHRRVYAFTEDAVLASWMHYRVPDIHELRLKLAASLLERVREEVDEDPDVTYVFNRFHISYAVWRWECGVAEGYRSQHLELVDQLRTWRPRILHPVLDPATIEARSRHGERQDLAWQEFLAWRTEHLRSATPGASYLAQQEEMQRLLEADGLPYRTVHVSADPSVPVPFEDLWLEP
jgi:hypothetical protein